jgi:hypothetical protein
MGQKEHHLIPMEPEILEILSPEDLKAKMSAYVSADGQNYIVELDLGGTTVRQLYSATGQGDFQADPAVQRDDFDLRLFPNFDLDAVRDILGEAGEQDARYYARLRLSPEWPFNDVTPFALEGGRIIKDRTDMGARTTLLGDAHASPDGPPSHGAAAFLEIDHRPDGFFISERGFCLVELKGKQNAGITPEKWEVGIDFGTSNTCLSYKRTADAAPEILNLPVLTTTLAAKPNYDANFGNVFEGASAVLDFFYKFSEDEQELMSQLYFPTQFLTQQSELEDSDAFSLRDGLIYFDNLGMSGRSLTGLVKGFPELREDLIQRFTAKQNIKWENADWLKVFMHHLRKQIVLTAASRNATVAAVHHSYPKAFDLGERDVFESNLKSVWGGNLFELASESEAARDHVVDDHNQHVIFDIGGGTTDIIAFHNQEPVFQTSFKLAAGLLNEYVVESHKFRSVFDEKTRGLKKDWYNSLMGKQGDGGLSDLFTGAAQSPNDRDVVQQIWLGLLQELSDSGELQDVLSRIRSSSSKGDAVQGFFLSGLLMMGGLSYFAGTLMHAASKGKVGTGNPFELSQVTITLTGNGSRVYNMLDHKAYPFSRIMEALFRCGLSDKKLPIDFKGLYRHNHQVAPKVTVALGLLGEGIDESIRELPVVDIACEGSYEGLDGETDYDTPLYELYQAIDRKDIDLRVPRSTPPVMRHFLESLDETLPYGRHGGEFDVVPDARADWCETMQGDLYTHAIPLLTNRIYASAKKTRGMEGVIRHRRPALEPLFIAQLAALIEAVRRFYANR